MPKQAAPVEINTFVGGLNTDATELTFPENSSLDEDNMVLNTDGDRQRRLGMDFEESNSTITTTQTALTDLAHTSFRWENAGGNADKTIVCIQFGNELKFFDLDNGVVSSEVIETYTFAPAVQTIKLSYAHIDGLLVVADGQKEITSFEYNEDAGTITATANTLKIRDLFSVEDVVDGENLFAGNNIALRPTTKTDEHIYNLRNQGWGIPRINANSESQVDPISSFNSTNGAYPSNSDVVTDALYPDADDSDNRNIERFFPGDLEGATEGSTEAPRGHFIIDALERGDSREAALAAMEDRFSGVNFIAVNDVPQDKTPGGATAIAEFAGRVFYAGFSGKVINGDNKSPRLSSYVLFSRTVRETSDIEICYQGGDPTSADAPDLVDTDGGFIRIDDAYGIKALRSTRSSLFVFATNGVWRVVGNEDSGFSATGYQVVKITDRGILGNQSIVEVEGSYVYWADDGIYRVSTNELGDWVAASLTRNKLDGLYQVISSIAKRDVQGYYDAYDKKVRWIYDNSLSDTNNTRELVLDAELGSFYTNTIYTPSGVDLPRVVGIFETEPFNVRNVEETVVVGADTVVSSGTEVTASIASRDSVTRSIYYIAVEAISPNITYSFCFYKNTDFYDFSSVDGTGTDAYAYLVTGYAPGGDFQRFKQVLTLTTHIRKTETGFTVDGNGDFVPANPSSCLLSTHWEWHNTSAGNRHTTPREAYRLNRVFLTDDQEDFDTGAVIISNRHKIRGKGRVLSMKFATSPGKDLQLVGWSTIITGQTNV